VVEYRHFRNDDPPGLATIWNEALTGRGEVRFRHCSPLENYIFAKPYFDAAGLIVARDVNTLVGFAHAGFGPSETGNTTNPQIGLIATMAVRPTHQHQGIGAELLRRAEAYLTGNGAREIHAGMLAPLNPFYFGLSGGSDTAGILESNVGSKPFLSKHGYEVERTCLVFQRGLHQSLTIADGRFPALRRTFEVRIVQRASASDWWRECVQGPIEFVEFCLEDKQTGHLRARATLWEMDLFSWRWNLPSVGITHIEVLDTFRRQGLGKFLLLQILHYLQDQFFGVAEVHAFSTDAPAIGLLRSAGFEEVDRGHQYRKVV
jgi:ribosomal protein S18 acetylase RimI-like enzyme